MLKNAFTMIELIFVIVILGILAAVAIPKLAATRDDAFDAKDCTMIATCVSDLGNEYTAKATMTLNASRACIEADTSTQNASITFTLVDQDSDGRNDAVQVSNGPTLCNHMNTTSVFGASSMSL